MDDAVDGVDSNAETAFEPGDWPVGTVALALFAALALLMIAPVVLMLAFPRALPDAGRRLTVELPSPQLQIHDEKDLARFRATEEHRLVGYYWVDRQNGVVHIPINEAMKKIAREGIPGFPQGRQ